MNDLSAWRESSEAQMKYVNVNHIPRTFSFVMEISERYVDA
jgi:hypothetical protein